MMRRYWLATVLVFFACSAGRAQQPELPTEPVICRYARLPERAPFASFDPARLTTSGENEPNNSAASAQAIPLGVNPPLDRDVDINGTITAFDRDFFQFDAQRGQILGVAVLAIDGNQLDSTVSVHSADGSVLVLNDDHQIGSTKIADLYPPESELPAGGLRRDAILSFAIPQDGKYFVRVAGSGASTGGYVAQVRLRESPLRNEQVGTQQILFLDFNGASLNAQLLFGDGGLPAANLSPLADFLSAWGIAADREDELVDAIVANVQAHFDELLSPVGAGVGITILNSQDDPDNFGPGNPFVSRVVVGGKIAELGIGTIGIAECIDPGNFSTDDTAVVLLDLLSAPASNPNSVLSLTRAPGVSVENAVAKVVAAVISHEAGHFLGCWHTNNANSVAAIMDQGGDISNKANVGPNGVLDTTDPAVTFVRDFYAAEGIGRSVDQENVGARVLAALAVGQQPNTDPSENAINTLLAGLTIQQATRPDPARGVNPIRNAIGYDDSATIVSSQPDRLEEAMKYARAKLEVLKKK